MNELLARVLDAHGGMDRWNNYQKVGATIVTGGGFFALKGVLQDATPRRMTVWLHEECPMELRISARCSRRSGSLARSSMGRWLPNATRPCIAPISTATRCGLISPRPFFSQWKACGSKRPNPGGTAKIRG